MYIASLSHPKSSIDLSISILFIGLCIAAHNEVTLTFPFALIVFNQCVSVESNIIK
jgi:hypothetical protein